MSKQRASKKRNMHYIANTINFEEAAKQHRKTIELVPKSRGQESLVLSLISKSPITVAVGPAGSGKTYLAMLAALKKFKSGKCDKIVLTRPAVEVDNEKHGFLPGDLNSKMEPWTKPLFDVIRLHYSAKDIAGMIEEQTIEIAPLAFMRGRTFNNAWIIADEMQNATPAQIKMLLTRIGENSKIVVTGDVEQTDRVTSNNGLLDLFARLNQNPVGGIDLCELTTKDIQRHQIIDKILDLYKN